MNFEGTNREGDAVDLTTTSGGGWLSVGLDSEAVVVSQTVQIGGVGWVSVSFWANSNITEHTKKEILKIIISRRSFRAKCHGWRQGKRAKKTHDLIES